MTKNLRDRAKAAMILLVIAATTVSCTETVTPSILIFSKTAGYRHDSIPAGIAAIQKIGTDNGYVVDATEDPSLIRDENLSRYQAVVFLNTTLDILDKKQQNDFERYIQAGGGFVGVHAASDTEYNWPWYNGLVGAYFDSHPNNPNVRTAEFFTVDTNHPSMGSMPDRFEATDEFYNFKSIKSDLIHVLVQIDESTYEGGTNGETHPVSWYHEYDGGRSFYTAMGHTIEMYSNPLFLNHLTGGIKYALGGDKPRAINYSKAQTLRVPEENRFTKIVLDEGLDEPVELAVMSDGRVLFIQRKGEIKLYDPNVGETKLIYTLPVSHKYKVADSGRDEAEDGLLGLAIDPKFDQNGWVYLYHSLAGERPVNVLTRWDFKDNQLVESSMKTLLEVEVQREQCCHTGGSLAFDAQGNLYLSTGDNTSPRGTAYAPLDERPGRYPWDAQKGSGNTNDLRGKILRITPQADGTYTIPDGNLFPVGTEKTRPEIYGMGTRNPYRISVDQKTGFVYWGDVGPDARRDSVGLGPNGYDEINQLRKPGFFGWPYFGGDNKAYYDFDFATNTAGAAFDPEKPVNDSPNNTGLRTLPQAQPAFLSYTYAQSAEFPVLGSGGRTAMAGPVYYKDLFPGAKRFPDYYDGKLFIYEWIRGWILVVTMDKDGDLVDVEPFMPSYKFSNPMDMEFGPEGDLYMLEYGTGWFEANENARLIRIEYNGGNRKPAVKASANSSRGAVPFSVDLSTEGTVDADHDVLTYDWRITSATGEEIATSTDQNFSFTFDAVGKYSAAVTVSDSGGEKATQELELIAGNAPPEVKLSVVGANSTFFFPDKPFRYEASATDLEDGVVPDAQVSVSIDFLKEGFDKVEAAQGHLAADESIRFAAGRDMIAGGDCVACHQVDKPSAGPMYLDIAKKYRNDPGAGDRLIAKVVDGGAGVWGDVPMPPHPTLSVEDVGTMISYILSLGADGGDTRLASSGQYVVRSKDMAAADGSVILRAAYQDKGANGMPPIRSQKVLTLRNPTVSVGEAVAARDVNQMEFGGTPVAMGQSPGAMLQFAPFDFTGLRALAFSATAPAAFGFAGGYIELRIDDPEGKVIGRSKSFDATTNSGQRPPPLRVDVPIEGITGEHSLYVYYRNESNPAGSLFVLTSFTAVPN